MRKDKMKILVVGAGAWGKNIIRVCDELGVLWGICELDENLRNSYRGNTKNPIMFFKDFEKFQNFQISHQQGFFNCDAVIVATPPSTHYEIALKALQAGKHVLVEKPMALSSNEGSILTHLAMTKNLVLMVGHLMRYHSAFIQLVEAVHEGVLGKIRYIYSNRLNDGKVRKDENVLWSFAPHDISMILALAGEEPNYVAAEGDRNVTLTSLKFPSGLRAHTHVNWLHPYKEQILVVLGDKGPGVFDDSQTWDSKLSLNGYPVKLVSMEPLEAEIEHFINCIENSYVPVTDGNEGVRVLKVLERAYDCLNLPDCLTNRENTQAQTSKHQWNVSSHGGFISGHPGDDDCILQINAQTQSVFLNFDPDKHVTDLPVTFIAPTAVVEEGAQVGRGTKIWHSSRVLSGSRVGKNCTIGTNVQIGPCVEIGNSVKIQNNVSVYKGVTVEDNVFIGPSVVFTNVKRPRSDRDGTFEDTFIRCGATIGANATIVCGVTIGAYSMVGAGAVVTKDVPSHILVTGNPAKFMRRIDKEGNDTDTLFIDKFSINNKLLINEKKLMDN